MGPLLYNVFQKFSYSKLSSKPITLYLANTLIDYIKAKLFREKTFLATIALSSLFVQAKCKG